MCQEERVVSHEGVVVSCRPKRWGRHVEGARAVVDSRGFTVACVLHHHPTRLPSSPPLFASPVTSRLNLAFFFSVSKAPATD